MGHGQADAGDGSCSALLPPAWRVRFNSSPGEAPPVRARAEPVDAGTRPGWASQTRTIRNAFQ